MKPVQVKNAIHMTRIPTTESWRSRDTALAFAQQAFERPSLKVVEMEPAGKVGIIDYDKELVSIEEFVLEDIKDSQSTKDELVLSGHNVKGDGAIVQFKQLDNVRTCSTMRPRIKRIDVEARGGFKKLHDEREAVRNFKFRKDDTSANEIVKTEIQEVI